MSLIINMSNYNNTIQHSNLMPDLIDALLQAEEDRRSEIEDEFLVELDESGIDNIKSVHSLRTYDNDESDQIIL